MRRCTSPVAGSRNSIWLPTVSPTSRLLPSGRQRPMVRLPQGRDAAQFLLRGHVDHADRGAAGIDDEGQAGGRRGWGEGGEQQQRQQRQRGTHQSHRFGTPAGRGMPTPSGRSASSGVFGGQEKGFQGVPARCEEPIGSLCCGASSLAATVQVSPPAAAASPPALPETLLPLHHSSLPRANTAWRRRTARRRGWRSARCR